MILTNWSIIVNQKHTEQAVKFSNEELFWTRSFKWIKQLQWNSLGLMTLMNQSVWVNQKPVKSDSWVNDSQEFRLVDKKKPIPKSVSPAKHSFEKQIWKCYNPLVQNVFTIKIIHISTHLFKYFFFKLKTSVDGTEIVKTNQIGFPPMPFYHWVLLSTKVSSLSFSLIHSHIYTLIISPHTFTHSYFLPSM